MTRLSKYFSGVAAKRLAAVEVDTESSNQHEINGVSHLMKIFGQERITGMEADFIYLGDMEEDSVQVKGYLTWYDSRENHPTRSEFRLYFRGNDVMAQCKPGDVLLIAKTPEDLVIVAVAKEASSAEKQLLWLFGIVLTEAGFVYVEVEDKQQKREVSFIESRILETLGIEPIIEHRSDFLHMVLNKFGETLPSTKQFSEFARASLPDVKSFDSPDSALLTWMNREEEMFRAFEHYQLEKVLKIGFPTVDDYIKSALSTLNRRKSRVGHAMENHLEAIFVEHKILFCKGCYTEGKSKPDFTFPGMAEYQDASFPTELLSMLGSKYSAKDRWRQILPEAKRIKLKHLVTLQFPISIQQTDEMKREYVQLVTPKELHATYTESQMTWLMSISDFVALLLEKQNHWNALK